MRKIRGLLVEDEVDLGEIVMSALDFEFQALSNWNVEWTICTAATEARKKILEADTYDFACVDIRLGEGQPGGFSVAEDLAKRGARTFVLVVTAHTESYTDFVAAATAMGANLIIRNQLTDPHGDWTFAKLAAKIRRHLIAQDPIGENDLLYDQNEIGIVSILESLGGPQGDIQQGARVVRSLAMNCLDSVVMQNPVFRLGYLAAGRSGAYVCRVDFSDENEPVQSFVLKVGLDKRALELELKANREAAKALSEQLIVRIIGNVETDISGYSAIIATIADRAVPLSAWLNSDASPEEARFVAKILFHEELRRLSSPELKDEIPAIQWMRSSAIMRLRVRATTEKVIEIFAHPAGANRKDSEEIVGLISDFTESGTLPVDKSSRLDGSVVRVRSFGDLHSSNVLVRQGLHPKPVLIDASRYSNHHWSVDSARMAVDIFLRVRAAGLSSMLWEDFDDAALLAAKLCPRCGEPELAYGDPADHFLHALISNLPDNLQFEALRIGEESWHWQWHIGLAKEFLRQGCHPDLSLPRSVLALVAGAHHLRKGCALIDGLKF